MKEEEFAALLAKSIDEEFESILAGTEEEHEFSPEFEAKMNELFSDARAKEMPKVRPKRWLLIAIAAVLLLAATACAVPQVRESIAGFFVKVFGDHVEYTDPAVTKERIEEEYGLLPIPEGFAVESVVDGAVTRITTYRNVNEDEIVLIQSVDPAQINSIDNEYGTSEEIDISGDIIRIYSSDYFAQASWVKEGYYFSLTYNAPISSESFVNLICSVKVR